jgi:ubiquinone/menaquinone biosynthesis C-methylase UbiE
MISPRSLAVDPDADRYFEQIAREEGLDPHNPWIGGYADRVWRHRHVYEASDIPFGGRAVLEFGCNVGATAIVLTALGCRVTGIDPSWPYLRVARANIARHGMTACIRLVHVIDSTRLPFANESFDIVTCSSVLEYVPAWILPRVQREIDRVLKRRGVIFVTSTSNRLWPREVHSQRWLTNYIPVALERALRGTVEMQRGVFPWQIRYGFGCYENLDRSDGGREYVAVRMRINSSPVRRIVIQLANVVASRCGVSAGLLAPTISVRLRKG